jgi:hypothetical protein
MENRTRQNALILRLSDDEKRILNEKFRLSGMNNKNAFIRHLIIYGYVYDIDYSELHQYNVNLSRIASNIYQIRKQISITGHIYENDIKEVKELMNQVWHIQESMLSKQPYIKQ